MAITQPKRIVASGAVGTASANDGTTAVVTAKVINTATGTKELMVTFSNSGTVGNAAQDTINQVLFPACWNPAPALDVRTTFTAANFVSITEYYAYFNSISSNLAGVRMETDNTDNYLSYFIQTEREPTGKKKTVETRFQKYRVPLGGGGYSETVELPKDFFHPLIWSGQEIAFSRIKAGSSITFYFNMEGWDKARELSALPAEII